MPKWFDRFLGRETTPRETENQPSAPEETPEIISSDEVAEQAKKDEEDSAAAAEKAVKEIEELED
ncbi:hypothetical protein COT99_03150 [Candidatus Falkowbacteria bacterium CG10_big_fil_rev_8_21_14_0_10_43_10]|uniref:Uncharacterized protein n=1 Tax=Candidatus Falkowbacteria bacterium CG10_big_fil_rev_8_21_14_0_10_43_10 TaxID=1974567 RepID=A0A2H0V1T0_9BACT|nr:MAG: hypothetical protein COT99_03150 [Candidatus Falkowbacteria bacterium CG10_big_fil_rev_8_21_14_0_10_43_10]